ncbi:TetR/AcrR family transcriptional regulator [Streptomyces bobili]|uniref:TetR/AcrR family transcriptional regulator n=1 Tax=Streptomyces bobili TaxID=67280 RepID=UPI0037224DD9
MTGPSLEPQRGRTLTTRARILDAARQELARHPDSSLADIAEAAGVARRTVYGHFAGRSALVEGLCEEAEGALRDSLTAIEPATSDARTALARFVVTLWPVADRYRMLLCLAPQDLGAEQVDGVLGPARATATAIIADGQRQGVFHTSVPPLALSRAIEAHILALLECVSSGTWTDDGTHTATSALIAAGVDGDLAAAHIRHLGPPELRGAREPGRPLNHAPSVRLGREARDRLRGGKPCSQCSPCGGQPCTCPDTAANRPTNLGTTTAPRT